MEGFAYKSLHHYLDEVFKNNDNPSKSEIIAQKKAYWKRYYRHYRKHRRKFVKQEFTLGFDRQTIQAIDAKKGTLSVSAFLYQCVNSILKDKTTVNSNSNQLEKLHQLLMELITLVEELLDEYDSNQVEQLLVRLESLEEQFSTLLISK